jgi:hypothetical protein
MCVEPSKDFLSTDDGPFGLKCVWNKTSVVNKSCWLFIVCLSISLKVCDSRQLIHCITSVLRCCPLSEVCIFGVHSISGAICSLIFRGLLLNVYIEIFFILFNFLCSSLVETVGMKPTTVQLDCMLLALVT